VNGERGNAGIQANGCAFMARFGMVSRESIELRDQKTALQKDDRRSKDRCERCGQSCGWIVDKPIGSQYPLWILWVLGINLTILILVNWIAWKIRAIAHNFRCFFVDNVDVVDERLSVPNGVEDFSVDIVEKCG